MKRLLHAMLLGAAAAVALAVGAAAQVDYPAVLPGVQVRLPADHGSHPGFRTEWWYVTGWLDADDGSTLGFQVTFFRTRPDIPQGNPSAFAPRQLVIAHVALSDPSHGGLRHDQRIARASHGLAGAEPADTDVWIGDWRLHREGDRYLARLDASGFGLDLVLERTQPPMLNGEGGFSRKGRLPSSASYYYSVPQLRVSGTVRRDGSSLRVRGTAWLDHEWSTALLEREAGGWDWIGINLDDGSALMAFRMRDREGGKLWAAATLRRPGADPVHFAPEDVDFLAGRRWTSPHTGIEYPVAFQVRAGAVTVDLEPLMDDQESDSRLTTGAVYWEGAVQALQSGTPVGKGYLELTGYGAPLALPGSGP
ncbi:MAG: carotenoid 1,2-hydratase [Proteobacteria bacterium]|nr:carotenoid 1,2-hydratase [Pseudomonadota bacterium]